MNKLNLAAQQSAILHLGWRQQDSLWINPERTSQRFATVPCVLHYELKRALTRAIRAEAALDDSNNHISFIGLFLAVGIAAVTVIYLMVR